ncbi:MAG: ferrous iron transport protein B [bacterium]
MPDFLTTTLAPPRPANHAAGHGIHIIALVGNPNAGKTTLFNALTGLRARTANFPGTTVERKIGRLEIDGHHIHMLDLPGIYSLNAATPEEQLACDVLLGRHPKQRKPDAAVLVVDATNLERNLFFVSQVLEHDIPVIVALNMIDLAERDAIQVDVAGLSKELGCPVIPVAARSGRGAGALKAEIARMISHPVADAFLLRPAPACGSGCAACPFQSRYAWTEGISARCVKTPPVARSHRTEKIDTFLTHPTIGLFAFALVMLTMFFLIFQVATVPMDLIGGLFARAGSFLSAHLPDNDLRSLLVDGIIGGVGGILVFLPQICILFFFLALMEDTGYLARAAFVMDRLMRRIGLPGKAFVPLLSAHACAIPAIMATRVIEDPRDRLVTILVTPLMSCSARIPVYTMVTALLFLHQPFKAALVFTGAYALGITAALGAAFALKRTFLPGESKPLVIELPNYRIPSLRTALLHTLDRASVFVRQAGTVIFVISVILWALATYPKSLPSPEVVQMTEQAQTLAAAGRPDESAALQSRANVLENRSQLEHSFAGRLGKWIEPVIRPLGFDWQIGIGIISSFAAREVIVSTLSIVYGVGSDRSVENPESLYDTLRHAKRTDGSPVFGTATCVSLLVFYVLAAQCLATQAVTRRETNSWKWPIFQIAYMSALAYLVALGTYQTLRALGVS